MTSFFKKRKFHPYRGVKKGKISNRGCEFIFEEGDEKRKGGRKFILQKRRRQERGIYFRERESEGKEEKFRTLSVNLFQKKGEAREIHFKKEGGEEKE